MRIGFVRQLLCGERFGDVSIVRQRRIIKLDAYRILFLLAQGRCDVGTPKYSR